METKGIEITFNNGERESFDPVNVDLDIKIQDDKYIVLQGGYEHEFKFSDIEGIREYELCEECKNEVGYCKYGCKNER